VSGGPADSEGQTEAGLGPDSGAATRKTFVEKVLGTHSSHPDVSRQRLAAWRWCGRGVTAIGAAFAAYTVYRAFQGSDSMLGGLLRAFRQIVPATDTLLMVVAFTLSATLTAALTIRMARLGAETRQASTRGLMAGTGTVILSCALAGLCLLFGWLVTTRSVDLIRENRWMIAVAAALPLEFILVYSEYKEGRERGGGVVGPCWDPAGILRSGRGGNGHPHDPRRLDRGQPRRSRPSSRRAASCQSCRQLVRCWIRCSTRCSSTSSVVSSHPRSASSRPSPS